MSGARVIAKSPLLSAAHWQWLRAHRLQVLLASAGVVLAWLLWLVLAALLDRPMQRAEINGKFAQVSRVQIEQALAPFAHAGFISIDLAAVRHALQAIAWIDHVRVERAWPDGLRVLVTEQVAVARWRAIDRQPDQQGLLNTRGELFLPNARDLPADLPQLSGPSGQEMQVARLYLDTYPRLLTVGLNLRRVILDERGAWNLQLSNGVEVRLGRQDVAARLERFIAAASPVIATRNGEVRYVDMRYSNGFAIGWAGQNEEQRVRGKTGSAEARVTSHGNV